MEMQRHLAKGRLTIAALPITFLVILMALFSAPTAGAETPADKQSAVPSDSPERTGVTSDEAIEPSDRLGAAVDPSLPHTPDEVLVKLQEGVSEQTIAPGSEPITNRWVKVPIPDEMSAVEALAHLAAREGVEKVELNYVIQLDPTNAKQMQPSPATKEPDGANVAAFTPNDPFYSLQWHMPAVQAPNAWDISRGSGAVVAVLDTGADQLGEDLTCHTFVAPFDAVTDTPGTPLDFHGHGLHVTGTIAQCTNNGVGVAGLAFNGSIMPVKVLDDDGFGSWADVAQGISWAVSHGADVINLSLGGPPANVVADAIADAVAADVVVVAASGNDGISQVDYPAAYPDVIAVGAVDYNRDVTSYSNYGAALDITAPGGDNFADENGDTYPDGVLQETWNPDVADYGYYFFNGTSMATPHVAGAAALLKAEVSQANRQQITQALLRSAADRGAPGRDNRYGHGVLLARNALNNLTSRPQWAANAVLGFRNVRSQSVVLELPRARDPQGIDRYRILRNGSQIATAPAGQETFEATSLSPNTAYRFGVQAVDNLGFRSPFIDGTVTTTELDTEAPRWPAGAELTFSNITPSSVRVGWPQATDNIGVDGYRILRDGQPLANVGPAMHRVVARDLQPGTEYESRVEAFDFDGNSAELVGTTRTEIDPCGRFDDVPCSHTFIEEIVWLANERITIGCNPPQNSLFCPDDEVTRGQMAAFLVRALDLEASDRTFEDTDGHLFEDDIAALAEAGVTYGCNPPDNTMFCPDDEVTRGQMAAFLVRALDLGASDRTFVDTDGHVFEDDIAALAEAGVTYGCNPPENTMFCPNDDVTRAQMAAFLHRALGT